MIVDSIELSQQLFQSILVLFFILRSFVRNLLVNLAKQRVKFQVQVLEPLPNAKLIGFGLSGELRVGDVLKDSVGLGEGAFRRE